MAIHPLHVFILALTVTGCGSTAHAPTIEPVPNEPTSTNALPTIEPMRRDPGPLAPRYTIQTVSLEITAASDGAPISVGALCQFTLEYGGTFPRCLANLDCGRVSLVADSNFRCQLYPRDAIGHDEMTTTMDDSPSVMLDTIAGTFEMTDDNEGRFGNMHLEGRVIDVVSSETPPHWR